MKRNRRLTEQEVQDRNAGKDNVRLSPVAAEARRLKAQQAKEAQEAEAGKIHEQIAEVVETPTALNVVLFKVWNNEGKWELSQSESLGVKGVDMTDSRAFGKLTDWARKRVQQGRIPDEEGKTEIADDDNLVLVYVDGDGATQARYYAWSEESKQPVWSSVRRDQELAGLMPELERLYHQQIKAAKKATSEAKGPGVVGRIRSFFSREEADEDDSGRAASA